MVDNKRDEECELTVNHDGYEDTFQGQLVKEWHQKCDIAKCEDLYMKLKKRKEKFQLFLHHHFNLFILHFPIYIIQF